MLAPLAGLYAWGAARRLAQPPSITLPMPVICVGNFTAGGTGKTPLAIHIAEHVKARGLSPVFLTRGYGGRARGPAWLKAGLDTARDVGDEPLLLSQSAPVMVARDRAAGARAIRDSSIRADVVIMDDGLQNPSVGKSLSIAVVDRRRGVGNGLVIPAGPLRAPLDIQLAITDAIVVNGSPADPSEDAPDAGRWLRERFQGPVIEARPEPKDDPRWLAEKPVVAFAGIANPARFFALAARLGARIVAQAEFGDHHAFTENDARRLLTAARRAGAALVTTEKDWVRLIGSSGALADLRETARPLAIRLALEARDAERLAVLLDGAIGQPAPGRSSELSGPFAS
jgi:tetraacyldisaccharide 4'-kinase